MAWPTVAKAPSRIPQDVRRDIIKLNELRGQILCLRVEHDRLGQEIANKLIPAVIGARS